MFTEIVSSETLRKQAEGLKTAGILLGQTPSDVEVLGDAFIEFGQDQWKLLKHECGPEEIYLFAPTHGYNHIRPNAKHEQSIYRTGLAFIMTGTSMPELSRTPAEGWSTERYLERFNAATAQTQFPQGIPMESFWGIQRIYPDSRDSHITDTVIQLLGDPSDILRILDPEDPKYFKATPLRTMFLQYMTHCDIDFGREFRESNNMFGEALKKMRQDKKGAANA